MHPTDTLFYAGTSGVALPLPKAQFPPTFRDKSRLHYYASLFSSVEVNSIFYKLPRASTIVNWRETVPPDFRFTFKVSKAVTHAKGLHFRAADVEDFITTVNSAGDKKGCLLAQLPPSLTIDKLDGLQRLLETVGERTQHNRWRIAVEFRHASWYEREVYELLREFDVSPVIQDMPQSATPLHQVTGDFMYLRFHGPEPRYRGDYADEVLKSYAGYIQTWMGENKTVFVYFNNTMGAAVNNALTLKEYVLAQRR